MEIKTIRKFFFPVLSVILTVVDIVSDIVLAVDYCVAGNKWGCGLTWTFIALPVPFSIAFLLTSDKDRKTFRGRVKLIKILKGIEVCFESGPQLLLQFYIIWIISTSGKTWSK